MTRIYENKATAANYLCMDAAGELAPKPFSRCLDCEYMSHMNCHAHAGEGVKNFAQNVKKALHFS